MTASGADAVRTISEPGEKKKNCAAGKYTVSQFLVSSRYLRSAATPTTVTQPNFEVSCSFLPIGSCPGDGYGRAVSAVGISERSALNDGDTKRSEE
jgi:hypothetical protein